MRRLVLLLALCTFAGNSANATQRLIVRATAGQAALDLMCAPLGCTVMWGLGDPAGQVFLIGIPDYLNPNGFIQTLLSSPTIADAEIDQLVSLGQTAVGVGQSLPAIPPDLYDNVIVAYYGTNVWSGYVNQPAAQIVRIADAQNTFGVAGTGTVAVIDTGVDPNHPVLRPVLVPGYDFTRNQEGVDETLDVIQPVSPVVNGVPPQYVNDSNAAVVDQSTVSVVDGQPYAAFGHGTEVSGVIHLVAPQALIMPLKAFQSNGYGYVSDIIRAIYWAVQHSARVINMSFSVPQSSPELESAVTYATGQETICAAAAGNNGSSTVVYPAGYGDVMAIASTDDNDNRSSFSNYGPWIWLAAPGQGIITTYPWATWAAASGTSFSTPFVSGTISLLLQTSWSYSQSGAANALAHAQQVGSGLGNGRLDIVQALQAASAQ